MDVYAPGSRLAGRYLLTDRLATGATAVVWRAVDELLDRPVAVKALHAHLADDHDLASRFADEARVAATVNHPSLVAVYDTIVEPHLAIVLEYVDGPDMRQRLDAGPCSIAEVLGLGWTVADALDVAHRAGLVHRDVKPANIICTSAGRPKLGDFGIATAAAGDRTATGLVLGTAKYLAPEQVQGGPIGPRTDVYALCVVLYEALCGQAPFDRAGDLPTAMARLEEPPPIPRTIRPEIPIGIESVVLRGLARAADARWPSAAALRDALALEADRLDLELGAISLAPLGSGASRPEPTDRPAARTAPSSGNGRPPGPEPTVRISSDRESAAPVPRNRSRSLRRVLAAVAFASVVTLGWILVRDGLVGDLVPGGSGGSEPVVVGASTFDPEGTGPPGEHDDLVANVIDGDGTTEWRTESYDDRSMGLKRGVGVVIELADRTTVRDVTISSDGENWDVEVYVGDTIATTLDQWGEAGAVAGGLGRSATLRPDGSGRAVLVWITDLGEGGPPFSLTLFEVAIS